MGGVSSCRCNKQIEATELNLDKEKKDAEKDNYENNINNVESITPSKANLKVNSPSFQDNGDNDDDEEEEYEEDDSIENAKATPNAKSEGENIPSQGHTKKNSNEIKMEIYEDNLNEQNIANFPFVIAVSKDKNGKKYSNLANNQNMINKPPLEVINEINADVSKDSFADGIPIKKQSKVISTINSDKIDDIIETQNKNFKEKDSSTKIGITDKNYTLSNNTNNTNSNRNNGEENNLKKKSNSLASKQVSKNQLLKNNTKLNQIITSIIPEHKLLNCEDGKILNLLN
jgi:hypothetical protein